MSEFLNPNPTPWGYIVDAATLPDLITTSEFSQYTNGKFGTTDQRIAVNIASASASIRNFCGWHVAPSLVCGMLYNVNDLRDAFIGRDLLIQLPAAFVTNVSKIILNAKLNTQTGDYEGDVIDEDRIDASLSGLIRVFDVGVLDRRAKIFVKYTAGYGSDAAADVKEIAASAVVHALTNTYGVNSEAAGGVSISYNAAWSGKGSTALTNDTRSTLDAYKARRVF